MKVRCAFDALVDVGQLKPNSRNPNKHPDEQISLLAKIMGHQGVRSPIVVSNQSGLITKGHGRLMAAHINKWTQFPVDYQDYESDADEYADMVADNKIAELSNTDMSMVLQDVLGHGPDFDFQLLGIPDFKLPEDFAQPPPEPEAPDDEEEELRGEQNLDEEEPDNDQDDELPDKFEARVKLGDIYQLGRHRLICGDSTKKETLDKLVDGEKLDCVVTDPPYGLSFMGKEWDYDVPSKQMWANVLDILKPGAHVLSFSGTRTYHRMTVNIEDAGFECRDMLTWNYGSGFPKSLDVSKSIDRMHGAEREVVGERRKLQSYGQGVNNVYGEGPDKGGFQEITAPATDDAKKWQGYGTGALNIDKSRIGVSENDPNKRQSTGGYVKQLSEATVPNAPYNKQRDATLTQGRWPANALFNEEAAELLDQQSGLSKSTGGVKTNGHDGEMRMGRTSGEGSNAGGFGDTGGASRFFYVAKSSKSERNAGLEGMPEREAPGSKRSNPAPGRSSALGAPRANHHPTVKPVQIMKYLVNLICPPGGILLEPFGGSGTTLIAADKTKHTCYISELNPEYCDIILARFEFASGLKAVRIDG